MAEEKVADVKKADEERELVPVRRQGEQRGLSIWKELDDMMDRMDRMFGGFYPGRWRWRGWPRPFEGMSRAFEETSPQAWLRPWDWPDWGWLTPFEDQTPRVDVIDRDDEIVVKAALPGVRKDDLDVSMTDDTVTIRATTSRDQKEESAEYYRSEISRGEFSRSVRLPAEVNADKAKATFKDGVVELVLPKTAPTKRRRIAVS